MVPFDESLYVYISYTLYLLFFLSLFISPAFFFFLFLVVVFLTPANLQNHTQFVVDGLLFCLSHVKVTSKKKKARYRTSPGFNICR